MSSWSLKTKCYLLQSAYSWYLRYRRSLPSDSSGNKRKPLFIPLIIDEIIKTARARETNECELGENNKDRSADNPEQTLNSVPHKATQTQTHCGLNSSWTNSWLFKNSDYVKQTETLFFLSPCENLLPNLKKLSSKGQHVFKSKIPTYW